MRRTPYETDAVEWAEQNAELIRARRWEEVDAAHILEELEALGTDRRSARDSYITRIIEHLLKLKYVTGEQTFKYNANLWRESVLLQQADLRLFSKTIPVCGTRWIALCSTRRTPAQGRFS